MSQRLFFALLPDAAAINEIIAIQQQLPADKLRLYSAENLHQTLVFLGEFAEPKLMDLISACNTVQIPPISMQFTTLTYWQQPKVLCLLSETVSPALSALVNALQEIVSQFDVPADNRPYRPHITLARKASEAVSLNIQPICFSANEFVLMQSVSSENGPLYQPLYRWPLIVQ